MTDAFARSRTFLHSSVIARMRIHLWLPWLVLAAALALTAHMWRHGQRNAERVLQQDFDFHVREAVSLIEQRMASYQQVLRGAGGLFSSSDQVSSEEFRSYVSALRLEHSHPGIPGISFIGAVPAGRIERFVDARRRQGMPRYAIQPEGERGEYAPVVFRESLLGGGLPAPGFDINADPMQRAALEQARELRGIALSGKVALPRAASANYAGFAMYLPIYRKSAEQGDELLGWVAAPIRLADLMQPPSHQNAHELDIEIYDGEEISGPTLMFDSDNRPMHADASPSRYLSFSRLQVANRTWTVAIRSLPRFEARLDKSAAVGAWFGAGVSVLLALVSWLLAGSRARALQAARDMTRELAEHETRYRRMFEHSASIACILDPGSGHIVDANLAAEAFWGYPLQRLRRMHIGEIAVAPQDGMQELLRQIRAGAAPHMEGRHRLANGELRDVELYAGLLVHQGKELVYVILHDITARKQAQEEQKRFVAMVSHEFRTPLATIDGAVQRLQATAGNADAATLRRYAKIGQATDRLTALLDDYLTQDRIDASGRGLHLSATQPLALLQDAAASAHALSAGHVIAVDAAQAPSTFVCDVDRMRLTLRVLADNAVKYTPPGSHITLHAIAVRGGIAFAVTDNGNGIAENELPHLFDKFFRGQRASRQAGFGLGLYLARAVVEMHGGTLSACNRPQGGCQFTIRLPEGAARKAA